MGNLCGPRRRRIEDEEEDDTWIVIPDEHLQNDEDTIFQMPSFDDDVSESSSSSEGADAAAGPVPHVPTEFPRLERGRLVYAGFRSIGATNERGMTRSMRNRCYWQHARNHVTRILRLRKLWSNIGRIMSSTPDTLRKTRRYRELASIWSHLGRTLQRLNAKSLCSHLVRRNKKLRYRNSK